MEVEGLRQDDDKEDKMIGWQIYFWVVAVIYVMGWGLSFAKIDEAKGIRSFISTTIALGLVVPALVILFKYAYGFLPK